MNIQLTPHTIKRIQQLLIRSKRAVLGSRQGIHSSHKKGAGLEFYEFKTYAAGDDFRTIDWGVLGRTDKAYVRRYEEEQESQVLVVIDGSKSAALDPRIASVGLGLLYAAVCSGDSVCGSMPGVSLCPWTRSTKQCNSFAESVRTAEPSSSFPLLSTLPTLVKRIRRSLRVLVLSDFLFDSYELMDSLNCVRRKNAEITCICFESTLYSEIPENVLIVDAETEIEMDGPDSQESRRLTLDRYKQHVDAMELAAVRADANFLRIGGARTTEEVLFDDLLKARILSPI